MKELSNGDLLVYDSLFLIIIIFLTLISLQKQHQRKAN